ncbi:MAG: hypothetical protein ACYCQI_15075 [Gammaproteobacteria bacterium]
MAMSGERKDKDKEQQSAEAAQGLQELFQAIRENIVTQYDRVVGVYWKYRFNEAFKNLVKDNTDIPGNFRLPNITRQKLSYEQSRGCLLDLKELTILQDESYKIKHTEAARNSAGGARPAAPGGPMPPAPGGPGGLSMFSHTVADMTGRDEKLHGERKVDFQSAARELMHRTKEPIYPNERAFLEGLSKFIKADEILNVIVGHPDAHKKAQQKLAELRRNPEFVQLTKQYPDNYESFASNFVREPSAKLGKTKGR